jgi:hypothetical protein
MRLRSDNGPQFKAGLFQAALKRWIVVWGNSTPHYPQSNGHAEAAVKTVKELVLKLAPSGDLSLEEFLAGLLEFRNTPHATGLSPAQIVFGLQLQTMVRPAHRSSHSNQWKEVMAARERQAKADVNKKIPLGPTITFAAIVTCWCTSTRPRSENEVMEPQRSDRCGRKTKHPKLLRIYATR